MSTAKPRPIFTEAQADVLGRVVAQLQRDIRDEINPLRERLGMPILKVAAVERPAHIASQRRRGHGALNAAVEAALDEVDDEIAEATRELAQKWLDMGYRADELPWCSAPGCPNSLRCVRAMSPASRPLFADAPPALQ